MSRTKKSAQLFERRISLWVGFGRGAGLATFVGLAGCAGSLPEPVGTPVADPSALAAEMIQSTTPVRPQRITFAWSLNEAGSRVTGRGVVRSEAPDRIRLDLFGPRNESYLSAALVEDEYRLPTGVSIPVALPSPAILWGGLGTIRPPAGAQLIAGAQSDTSATVRYRAEDGTLYQYDVSTRAGRSMLRNVERSGSGGRLESVRLTRDPSGRITKADYRNWSAFRDLTLEIDAITDSDPFPQSTWQP
jgi:hypothetical protein